MAIPRRGRSVRRESPVERHPILVLGQDAFQAGIRRLDRGHRLVDQLADARLLGVSLKVRPTPLLRHPECSRPDTRRSSAAAASSASSAVPLMFIIQTTYGM